MSNNATFTTLGASNHSKNERHKDDYYATDPKAVEELLLREKFNENILECACGEGHISEVLKANGYNVISRDLIDRGYGEETGVDFLTDERKWSGDIITNPPYKYAQQFVEKSLEIINAGAKVAMLLKIQFLESKSRKKLFEKHPPKYVYVFSARTNCAKNGDFETFNCSAICYAWYVWQKGFKGETIVRWI